MADQSLEDLFARLKSPPTNAATFSPPTVASPTPSQPVRGTPPILTPEISGSTASTFTSDQRTSNLLNLLKFNSAGSQPQTQITNNTSSQRSASATKPISLSQRNPSNLAASSTLVGAEQAEKGATTSAAQKDYLLNLLNGPKEPATGSARGSNNASPLPDRPRTNEEVDKLAQAFAETSVQAPQTKATKSAVFTNVSPFDNLHLTSPRAGSSSFDAQKAPRKIEILKHSRDTSSTSTRDADVSAPLAQPPKSPVPVPSSSPLPTDTVRQSVSEALGGVGDKISEEADRALAQAIAEDNGSAAPGASTTVDDKTPEDDATKKNGSGADNEVDSSWESAEDEAQQGEYEVPVHNFPMKPFVCIQLLNAPPAVPLRQDSFMMIAQLKKKFDQMDRSLISATQTHIGYAQIATKKDNRGLRIIRQDTGDHKQVFRTSGERVFHVQFCTSRSDIETVLGIGVNGSVFWTSLAKSRGDLFLDDDLESHGFVMPAVATIEEQTSGSPVKTRAKMSTRHPEYFALARGKTIHIVAPETVKSANYCDTKTRNVDSEKYLAEHCLKITIGKAGKDFAFSDDDSVIASLDKSGRLKFWDIRELTRRAMEDTEAKHEPLELTEPTWTLTAAASDSKPDEKPSVSSIMFLDKDKVAAKGTAQRYMIIGFKQNHILQLYDLALKKSVQEVRLPHEKDSDGFCSITYHPRVGIIAVGHPTRNSIYFIHLSAPKYTFPAMDQAELISRIAGSHSAGLSKPETTAIMSGVRELSFAKVGHLRSVDMLREPVDEQRGVNPEEEILFELYVMHSKGATGISIKRRDLGWDNTTTTIKPMDAIESGFVEVRPMDMPSSKPVSEQASATDSPIRQQTPSSIQEAPKATPTKAQSKKEIQPLPTAVSNGAARKLSDRSVKQSTEAPQLSQPSSSKPIPVTAASATESQSEKSVPKEIAVQGKELRNSAQPLPATTSSSSQTPDYANLQTVIAKHFDSLYQRIDGDRRVQDAAGAAKQDAVLRLVSSTLTENVEKSLDRIISSTIEKVVLPNFNKTITKAIEKKLAETVPQSLNNATSKEIKNAVPNALQQALKDPQVVRGIADQVASKVQHQVTTALQQSMPTVATQTSQKMISESEARMAQKLHEAETRRQQDNAKILELSELVRKLSETLGTMCANQAAFQEQMLKLQQLSEERAASENAPEQTQAIDPAPEPEDDDIQRITQMLIDGRYDDATLEWLQSPRQAEIFDTIFVRVNPQYLQHVRPLVALSVSAAITASFDTNVAKRLDWLDTVLDNIDLQDGDIRDVAPKIMDVLSQRLQEAYMQIAEENATDPALRRLAAVTRHVQEVKRLSG